MKIKLNQIIINNEKYYDIVDTILDECLLNLITKNILTISDIFCLELDNEYDENRPCIALVMKDVIDDGDYDMYDEYQENYQTYYSYEEIKYCPICGEKIQFEIVRIIDKSQEFNDLDNKIKLLEKSRKPYSKKVCKELELLNIMQRDLSMSHL